MTAPSALPSELTIYTAAETRTALLATLAAQPADAEGELALDGGAVAEVDGAGLQLLVSLARSLESRGRRLRVDRPTSALSAACSALGLAHLIATPAEAA
jgi:anti-anti-sigma regulatory factor